MNKNEIVVSIILPIYNVENYIKKCINSILNQTYKKYEVILVDDGSTDNSGKICDEYVNIDNRVKVIHKKNGGVADARNTGIEIANGKYIVFVDPDDYIDEKYIEILVDLAIKNQADLVCSGSINYHENIIPLANYSEDYEVISKKEAYRKILLQEDMDVSAWGKIYTREVFSNIRFPSKELYEDIKIIDKIIEKCNKIVYTKYKGYFYLQRNGSIMYSKINEEKITLIDAVERLMKMVKELYPDIEYAAVKRYVKCNYHLLGRTIYDDSYIEISKKIRKNILKYKRDILKRNSIFDKKDKIATIVLSLGLNSYKMFWKIYCKIKNKKLN